MIYLVLTILASSFAVANHSSINETENNTVELDINNELFNISSSTLVVSEFDSLSNSSDPYEVSVEVYIL